MNREESGQLMVIVALSMVAFIGFTALVVDLGYAYSQRRFAQNASDAAAMAAVRMIRVSDPSTSASVIYTEMTRVAALNGNAQVDNANTVFLDVSGNSLGSAATYNGALSNVAGVRVKTRIQHNTFFAGVMGINTLTAAGSSSAMSMSVNSVAGTGVRPMAVPVGNYNPGESYIVWDDDMAAPGNAGWLDFDAGSNGSSDLGDWLRDGFSSSGSNQFTHYGGGSSPGSAQTSTSLPFPAWVEGNPGVKASAEDDLQSLIGQSVTVMLYDDLTGSGSSTKYRISGMVQFNITAVDLTGNPKRVTGTFQRMVLPDAGTGSYTTDLMSTVRLVPPVVPTSVPLPTSAPVPTATPDPGWPTATPESTAGATSTPVPTATSTPLPTATPTPVPAPPAIPTNLTTTVISNSSIKLDWTDPSGTAVGFYIVRQLDGDASWTNVNGGGMVLGTTFTDTGLQNNKLYWYRVRAWNSGGYSDYTAQASGHT